MCIQTVSKKYPNPEKERNPINGKSAYAKWISKRGFEQISYNPGAEEVWIAGYTYAVSQQAPTNDRDRIFALLSDPETREEIVDRLSQPWTIDVLKEIERIRKEHDAALLAREREKWEKEQSQQELQPSFDDIDELNRKVEFYQKRMEMLQCWQSSMRDPERKIVCDILANGFTLTTKEEVDNAAAQARGDVLKEIFAWLCDPDGGDMVYNPKGGLFSIPSPFNAVGLVHKLESLHHGQKQEREKR